MRRNARAGSRSAQVLDAASACFARGGFHGASIAQIAKQAGMSPGHIYHFFANKEAIIAAIVERRVREWLELLESIGLEADVMQALLDGVGIGLEVRTHPDFAGLWLEVLAEAARNPAIASAVREADQRIRATMADLLRRARAARGIDTGTSVDALIEVLFALYEGLTNRAVINPGLDKQAIVQVLRSATHAIYAA